jgi:hypothetical protein
MADRSLALHDVESEVGLDHADPADVEAEAEAELDHQQASGETS